MELPHRFKVASIGDDFGESFEEIELAGSGLGHRKKQKRIGFG